MFINLTQETSYFNTVVIVSILVNILDIFAVVCIWPGLDEVAKIETPLDLVAMLQYCWSNCSRYWQLLAEIAILIKYIKRGTKHYYVHSIGIFTFDL